MELFEEEGRFPEQLFEVECEKCGDVRVLSESEAFGGLCCSNYDLTCSNNGTAWKVIRELPND